MEAEQQRALIIVAHPDDADFGCGGSSAVWASEGWDITLTVCTDGAAGGGDDATEFGEAVRRRTVATRQQEQRAAAEVLGVRQVEFLNYPDGLLVPSLELRRDLVRMIRRVRPQRVVCMSPERNWQPSLSLSRYHPDHLAAGQAALAAIYPAAQNPWDFPELLDEGLLPHRVTEVLITGTPYPNHYVDISATIDQKIAAICAHASQIRHPEQVAERMKQFAAENGERHGVAYAELFHRTTQ